MPATSKPRRLWSEEVPGTCRQPKSFRLWGREARAKTLLRLRNTEVGQAESTQSAAPVLGKERRGSTYGTLRIQQDRTVSLQSHLQPKEHALVKKGLLKAGPDAAAKAAAAKPGPEASQDDGSSYEYETSEEQEEPAVVVRRYQKQATKTELPGKAEAAEKKAGMIQRRTESLRVMPHQAKKGLAVPPSPCRDQGRGASRPDDQDEDDKEGEGITLKKGPGATRPTEAEADSAEVGGPEGARPKLRMTRLPAQASQECALWHVSKRSNSLTTPSLSR